MPENLLLGEKPQRDLPLREVVLNFSWSELERLGAGELVGRCRDAGIRDIQILGKHTDRAVIELEIGSPVEDTLFAKSDCVDQWELVTEKPQAVVYLLEISANGSLESTIEDQHGLIGPIDIASDQHGVVVTLLGTENAIRTVIRNFQRIDISPNLRRLGDYSGDQSNLEALTARQCEAIKTAYRLGFYEVPRQASTADVADELGVDAATVSELLQRAERNLLSEELPFS